VTAKSAYSGFGRGCYSTVIRIWSNLPQDVQNHLFQSSFGERLLALLGVMTLGAIIHVLGTVRARWPQWPGVEQANNRAG
jgi:hypothetical protein